MGMKQAYQVMESDFVNSNARLKLLLISLANFAGDNDSAYAHSGTLEKHVGVKAEQIRRMKRRLENLDAVAFDTQRGRGRSQHYQLNMPLIMGINKTPPRGGILQDQKPHLFLPKTPPIPQQNPTSNGGPILNKYIKGAASQGTRHINDVDCKGAGLTPSLIIDPDLTRNLEADLMATYGQDWFGSWIDGGAIMATPERSLILVTSAFRKTRVKTAFQMSRAFSGVEVMTVHEYERENHE